MPPAPEADVELQTHDRHIEARYLGGYALERYKRQMELSTRACADAGKSLLLVDITDLKDYEPTTLDRHKIGVAGASLSRHLKKVAVVGTAAQLGPDPFATMVAQNRGLTIKAFRGREEALRWLLEAAAPPQV
jgi:SpoIIAA-like